MAIRTWMDYYKEKMGGNAPAVALWYCHPVSHEAGVVTWNIQSPENVNLGTIDSNGGIDPAGH